MLPLEEEELLYAATYNNDEIKIIQLSNAAGKKKMQNHGKAI